MGMRISDQRFENCTLHCDVNSHSKSVRKSCPSLQLVLLFSGAGTIPDKLPALFSAAEIVSHEQADEQGLCNVIPPWIHHFCMELEAKTDFSDVLKARAQETLRFIAAWPHETGMLRLAKDVELQQSSFSAMVANRLDRFLFENEWDGMLLHRSTMVHTDEPDFLVHYFGDKSTLRLVGLVSDADAEDPGSQAAAYAARANQSEMFDCTEHPLIISLVCTRDSFDVEIVISGRNKDKPTLWRCPIGTSSWHDDHAMLLMKLYHAVHDLPDPLPAPLSAPLPFPQWNPDDALLLSHIGGSLARSVVRYGDHCYKFVTNDSLVQAHRNAKKAISQLHVLHIDLLPPSSSVFAIRLPYLKDIGNEAAEPAHFLAIADQLQQLHRHGLVHGDVRRSNLLLASDPSQSLLIDFDFVSPLGSYYISTYNPSLVERHPDARPREEMLPEHDIHSLLYIVLAICGIKEERSDPKWNVVIQQLVATHAGP